MFSRIGDFCMCVDISARAVYLAHHLGGDRGYQLHHAVFCLYVSLLRGRGIVVGFQHRVCKLDDGHEGEFKARSHDRGEEALCRGHAAPEIFHGVQLCLHVLGGVRGPQLQVLVADAKLVRGRWVRCRLSYLGKDIVHNQGLHVRFHPGPEGLVLDAVCQKQAELLHGAVGHPCAAGYFPHLHEVGV